LWWKLVLVALALIGAGAGVAAVLTLKHHHNSASARQGSGTPTGAPTSTGQGLQIVDAINQPVSATGPLPAGYKSFTEPASAGGTTAGFQLAYPSNWPVVRTSAVRVRFTNPQDRLTYLAVDLTPHTKQDMLAEATYIRNQSVAQGHFPGYHQIGLQRLTIRGRPAAFWKFTWMDSGVQEEVLDLLYIADTPAGPQSYALYFTAPTSQWSAMHTYFNEEAETFAPLS
jgi:hypothetical protein